MASNAPTLADTAGAELERLAVRPPRLHVDVVKPPKLPRVPKLRYRRRGEELRIGR